MGVIGVDWKVLVTQLINYILLIISLLIPILLIVFLVRRYRKNSGSTPVDVANDMYAKGKISLEQLDQIKKALQKNE